MRGIDTNIDTDLYTSIDMGLVADCNRDGFDFFHVNSNIGRHARGLRSCACLLPRSR